MEGAVRDKEEPSRKEKLTKLGKFSYREGNEGEKMSRLPGSRQARRLRKSPPPEGFKTRNSRTAIFGGVVIQYKGPILVSDRTKYSELISKSLGCRSGPRKTLAQIPPHTFPKAS